MRMKPGDLWHCTNPACACEVLVESIGSAEGKNPRCSCMKKKYASPALTYLDFVYLEEGPKITTREE